MSEHTRTGWAAGRHRALYPQHQDLPRHARPKPKPPPPVRRRVPLADLEHIEFRPGYPDDDRLASVRAADPQELPPITLWERDGRLSLLDGCHRLTAARMRGDHDIDAEVHR